MEFCAGGAKLFGTMGKGDRRSKRGKIFQGTTGKTRPKGKVEKKKKEQKEKEES